MADLITPEEAKEFLESIAEGEGGTSDQLIAALISAASAAILRYTDREFTKTAGAVERRYAHDGGTFLDLGPYDLRTLEVIKIEATEAGEEATVLEASDYSLRPLPARDGVYQWIELAEDPDECEISIKGDWGFAAVPDDVKHLTKLTVAAWLRNDVFAYTPDFEPQGDAIIRSMIELLPRGVRGGLSPYKRVSVG